MEQTLYIVRLYEIIDMGCRRHEITVKTLKLADMTEGSQWLIDECEGFESFDRPNDIIRIKWFLTVDHLTNDRLDFTFHNQKYTLNRYWQVVGSNIEILPNPYLFENVRFVFYFGTDEKDENARARLKELTNEMVENEDNPWKNIPLAKEALHILKDKRKSRTVAQAKALCNKVISKGLVDPTSTPRLFLSFLDYYHRLLGSAYYKDDLTYDLLNAVDPDYDDEEFLQEYKQVHKEVFDPVQRTPQWEEIIYDVEKECAELMKGTRRGRGYCRKLWKVKKEVLAKYGIDWKSPAIMNPNRKYD